MIFTIESKAKMRSTIEDIPKGSFIIIAGTDLVYYKKSSYQTFCIKDDIVTKYLEEDADGLESKLDNYVKVYRNSFNTSF